MANMRGEFSGSTSIWPYANDYMAITSEGHHRQAPAVGSPTLIWHMALWPNNSFGEREEKKEIQPSSGAQEDPTITAEREAENDRLAWRSDKRLLEEYANYDADGQAFFTELSKFAIHLQERGRIERKRPAGGAEKLEDLTFDRPSADLNPMRATHDFKVCEPQALAFTLWWRAAAHDGSLNVRPKEDGDLPTASDLRVRCHLQTFRDHVTVSFYLDVSKPYGGQQFTTRAAAIKAGGGRVKIQDYIDHIRKVADTQIRNGDVDLGRLPERDVSKEDAEGLLAAADYLYDGVWKNFAKAFDIDLDWIAKCTRDVRVGTAPKAERFADFRGVMMSVKGIETDGAIKRRTETTHIWERNVDVPLPERLKPPGRDSYSPADASGTTGIGDLDQFDHKNNEANTVLTSMWPFLRRMSPWADYRDFVGCGIAGWRALYVAALGAGAKTFSTIDEVAKREDEVPGMHLSGLEEDLGLVRPIRYLVLTKGEPHREQIGRFLERINAVGTMRLFALKGIGRIRNASIHIELLGRLLDGVLQQWGERRQAIEKVYDWERDRLDDDKKEVITLKGLSDGERVKVILKVLGRELARALVLTEDGRGGIREYVEPKKRQDVEDAHVERLSIAIRAVERKLIFLGGWLDNIGEGGSGRIMYSINRARAFAQDFELLYKTLDIGDINGWTNYKNFVERGLMSIYRYITMTGDRLVSLRSRLQTVTETIQTTALIIEAEATRYNTKVIRQIESYKTAFFFFIIGLTAFLLKAGWDLISFIVELGGGNLLEAVKSLIGMLIPGRG